MGVVDLRTSTENRSPGQFNSRWQVLFAQRGEELWKFHQSEGRKSTETDERLAYQFRRWKHGDFEHVQEGVHAQTQRTVSCGAYRGQTDAFQAHQRHAEAQVLYARHL